MSPTFQVSDGDGVRMVGVGKDALVVIVIGVLNAVAPCWSVTRRRAANVPLVEYTYATWAPCASSYWPSPFKSQSYVSVSPSWAGMEKDPSKFTVSGGTPPVGVAVATAFKP